MTDSRPIDQSSHNSAFQIEHHLLLLVVSSNPPPADSQDILNKWQREDVDTIREALIVLNRLGIHYDTEEDVEFIREICGTYVIKGFTDL